MTERAFVTDESETHKAGRSVVSSGTVARLAPDEPEGLSPTQVAAASAARAAGTSVEDAIKSSAPGTNSDVAGAVDQREVSGKSPSDVEAERSGISRKEVDKRAAASLDKRLRAESPVGAESPNDISRRLARERRAAAESLATAPAKRKG